LITETPFLKRGGVLYFYLPAQSNKEKGGSMKRLLSMVLILIPMSIALWACGGGGGGDSSTSPQTQPIAGIWNGTLTSNVVHQTYSVTGIITEHGNARFVNLTNGCQYSGIVSISGSTFSTTATAYAPYGYMFPDGSHVGIANISGSFSSKGSMTGTYSGVGDSGSFSLNYSPLYETPSSLSSLSGTWTGTVLVGSGPTSNITIIIDSNGNLSGSSTAGCVISGNAGIIDSSYNAYIFNLVISNCGAENGTYSGLGAVTSTVPANYTAVVSVSDASYSFAASMLRQ
jgi:hypothetical protein